MTPVLSRALEISIPRMASCESRPSSAELDRTGPVGIPRYSMRRAMLDRKYPDGHAWDSRIARSNQWRVATDDYARRLHCNVDFTDRELVELKIVGVLPIRI